MEDHRLKREIIATAVTNSTINRMGATFLLRMQEDSGRSPGEVAKAFTISRETLDARALWAQIDALDGKVPESVQIDALQVIWSLQRSMTRWLLARPRSEEHTSELQSLMRISYAVFCLQKKNKKQDRTNN